MSNLHRHIEELRAEIASLTAELAAARAVPADMEAAIASYTEAVNECGDSVSAGADLRAAIARAIESESLSTIDEFRALLLAPRPPGVACPACRVAAPATVGGLLATDGACPEWCATHDPRDMSGAMDGDRRYASAACRAAGQCLSRGPIGGGP